jgi:hypothetical protein
MSPYKDEKPYTRVETDSDGKTTTGFAQLTADADKWKHLVDRGRVTIARGDSFNIQEGNIYDFGGYWNYNLGNSYAENHLDQSPKLNKTYDKDLLDTGGPEWTKIDWSKARDTDASQNPGEDDIKIGTDDVWDDSTGSTNVWVEKKFGNAYTYSAGKSIEVTKGDSLEIQHGGRHVEMGFRGDGSIKSWTWSEKGVTKEKKWNTKGDLIYKADADASSGITTEYKYCRDTGNMLSYNTTHQGGNAVHSFDFRWANTASAAFTFAANTSFDFKMDAGLALSIAAGAQTSISVSAAAKIDISAEAALFLKINAGAGIGMKIEGKPATLTYESTNGKFRWNGPGTRVEKEAALKAKANTIIMDTLKAQIGSHDCKLINSKIRFEARKLGVKEGYDFHL